MKASEETLDMAKAVLDASKCPLPRLLLERQTLARERQGARAEKPDPYYHELMKLASRVLIRATCPRAIGMLQFATVVDTRVALATVKGEQACGRCKASLGLAVGKHHVVAMRDSTTGKLGVRFETSLPAVQDEHKAANSLILPGLCATCWVRIACHVAEHNHTALVHPFVDFPFGVAPLDALLIRRYAYTPALVDCLATCTCKTVCY
jgi:hypothetical protein